MSDETQDLPEQTIEETTSVVEENDSSVHPGWDKMLAELPEAWHSKVKPYLQDNDRTLYALVLRAMLAFELKELDSHRGTDDPP